MLKVILGVMLCILLIGGAFQYDKVSMAKDWRTASMESTGIAPNPAKNPEAIVQVYAARAFSWRGIFAVHTWIAVKPANAKAFRTYEVIGWNLRRGNDVLSISGRPADGRWFDAEPEVIADIRGEGVDEMIKRIDIAAHSYPYMRTYYAWSGPNSNTFVAHVARAVPELKLDLPPTAIGKDFILGGGPFAQAPSGTGYQFSVFGVLGLLVGKEEGLEVNLLGLTFGIDPLDYTAKVPFVGRVGPER